MPGQRQTRWNQTVNQLVTLMRARVGYVAPDDPEPGIVVYDAAEVFMHQGDFPRNHLVIGWSGAPASPEEAGRIEQERGPMGPHRSREESGSIRCVAVAQTGDAAFGEPAVLRAECEAIMEDVAEECRADPTLGVDTSGTVGGRRHQAWVTVGTPLQGMDGGVYVVWEFSVDYTSRV